MQRANLLGKKNIAKLSINSVDKFKGSSSSKEKKSLLVRKGKKKRGGKIEIVSPHVKDPPIEGREEKKLLLH